jgi:hypothetical protein
MAAPRVCSCKDGPRCKSPGKHPVRTGWRDEASLSGPDIAELWTARPHANLGVATGAESGIFRVDIDPRHGGHITWVELIAAHGELPPTRTIRTGSGGTHYEFTYPDFPVISSADTLGRGVDVRGAGGLVVEPPSVSGMGPYTVTDDRDPVPAPGWLLAMLRPLADRVGAGRAAVTVTGEPVDLDAVPARLAELLAVSLGDGEGRHRHFFRIVAEARRDGYTQGQAVTIAAAWDAKVGKFGARVPAQVAAVWAKLDAEAEAITFRPAAQLDGETGDEHELLTQIAAASRADQLRAALLDSAGLDSLPVPEPLIDGLVYRDSLCWLHGKPGHCKSFVALDWACCVAAGLPWLGRPVTQGPVLYVIAEGTSGLHARVRAWEDRAREQTTVRFLPVAIQMLRIDDVEALAVLAAEMKYALVVIDTQARVTVGAEENSAVDMGRLVDAAEKIRVASGACVMFVHHEARAGDNMRGSTALEGAATTILRVEKDGSRLQLTNPKQKDAAEADPMTLWVVPRLHSVVIAGKPDTPTLESRTASETKILGVLLESFGSTGASATTLRNATGLAESTFHWALNRLVKDGEIQNVGTRARSCYIPAQGQLTSGAPTTPMNSNSKLQDSNPPIGEAIGVGWRAPLEPSPGCLSPGCPKPPRRDCATCWDHAHLEANR